MAQSGHGWPAGQYHPDGPDHTGTAGSNDLGLSYGNEIDTDSEMMYMPDWGTMNQTAGSLAVQNHATAPSQQFYQPQSYYQANGGFAQASSAESRGDSASPAVPFGSGVFQDPTFQRSGHQQHQDQQAYQQFNNAGPNQHNVPATRSLSDNSWQTGHAPQNQYTQQTFSYGGHQPTYQQQIQSTSHSHAQTPPPGLRSAAHFAGTQIEQAIPQANASQTGSVNVQTHLHPQPPNQSAAQYQFQISQGQVRKSPYQNAAALGLPNPAPFQNPVRFAQPNHAVGHSNVSMSKPQGSTQQAIAAAVGSVSHLQKPVRTGSPATYPQQLAVAQSPGVSYANGHQTFAPIMAAGSTLQPQHDAVYVPTYVPSRPPFDPIAQGGFTKLGTYANLFLSDRPVESPILEIIPEDTFPFSAHFNGKDAALLPNRARRLPCEIRRDWKWLRKQEKGADSDAKRRAIVIERDRLDREMINVNGEHIEPSTRVGVKKTTTKSESKLSSSRRTGSESSDDSSEYDSESDYEESKEDLEARKIKAAGKPSDPVKAVEYDVINAVWHAPDEVVQPNTTANAIQAFGVHIEKLWVKAKDLKKDVKAAKEKKSKKLDSLDAELTTQLKLMRAAIDAVNKYAETSVLENMGGNAKLAVILWNALRSSIASKDFNGALPKAILFLMSHFTTMERSLVVGVLKVPEFQKKHQKDFDKTCNGYLEQIISKAKSSGDSDKRTKDTTPANGAKDSAPLLKKAPMVMARDLMSASKKPASSEVKKAQPIGASVLEARKVSAGAAKVVTGSPSKRPRDDDVDSRATKKIAVDGLPSTSLTPKPASATTKTTVVQPRPKSSGSILPGRLRPTVKPAAKKPEPSQPSSLSTISGLLAEIAKPKSPPRQKDEPTRAPETEQEKQRRIHKEARRRLRVTWKPDHELEQVRIFQHDAAEDEGRASNMVRDARDNRSEGQALKRARVNESEDPDGDTEKDDEEENTHDGKPKETALREWVNPGVVDFNHISQVNSGQRDKSFVTRGGTQMFHTEAQTAMEKYEQTQLMEVYTSLSDIPDTPKSPLRRDSEQILAPPRISQLPADTPNLQELHLRWTEGVQLGASEATQRMLQRLRNVAVPGRASEFDRLLLDLQNAPMSSEERNQPYAFAPSVPRTVHKPEISSSTPILPMSQPNRDAEVLRLLSSTKLQKWVDPNPFDISNFQTQRRFDYGDPKIQADVDAVESVATAFIGKPYPAAELPDHMKPNLAFVKEWQMGYDKDMADKATRDATERAQRLAEEFAKKNEAAAIQLASQPVPQPVTQAAQDPQAAIWAAYFAQMGQTQAQPQQVQSVPGQQLTQDQYAAILQQTQALQAQHASHGAQPQYQQQQQPPQQDSNAHIGALLAALGGQSGQPQTAAPIPQPAQQDPNAANAAAWAAYYASLGQPQQDAAVSRQPQTQQQPHKHRDRDRDRSNRNIYGGGGGGDAAMLDYGDDEVHDNSQRGRKDNSTNNNIKDSFRRKDYDGKGINRSLIGTKPCTFWAQGKCAKGDQCTFRHDPNDLVD